MDRIDATVIGAGVIGLAVARALALAGKSVLILEREDQIGSGISSRNSEVIHAGLYYASGSLKERLCVAGRHLLYGFCESHKVPHRRCGKLIFANADTQTAQLEEIAKRGEAAGVDDLELLDSVQAEKLEPALGCAAAILSPSTGLIDSHALMLSLLGEAEDNGAILGRNTALERIEFTQNGWIVHAANVAYESEIFVNAAGLEGWDVAKSIDALDARDIPAMHLAKGNYFEYSGRIPFQRLIYPIPEPGGLGVHLTFDMAGRPRFGPDVEWVDEIEYSVDPARKPGFVVAAQNIWHGLDPDSLNPAYCGIRPKLSGLGDPAADFLIQDEAVHGLPGLVNLFGIESPGLTASLAIGDSVAGSVLKQ